MDFVPRRVWTERGGGFFLRSKCSLSWNSSVLSLLSVTFVCCLFSLSVYWRFCLSRSDDFCLDPFPTFPPVCYVPLWYFSLLILSFHALISALSRGNCFWEWPQQRRWWQWLLIQMLYNSMKGEKKATDEVKFVRKPLSLSHLNLSMHTWGLIEYNWI